MKQTKTAAITCATIGSVRTKAGAKEPFASQAVATRDAQVVVDAFHMEPMDIANAKCTELHFSKLNYLYRAKS